MPACRVAGEVRACGRCVPCEAQGVGCTGQFGQECTVGGEGGYVGKVVEVSAERVSSEVEGGRGRVLVRLLQPGL